MPLKTLTIPISFWHYTGPAPLTHLDGKLLGLAHCAGGYHDRPCDNFPFAYRAQASARNSKPWITGCVPSPRPGVSKADLLDGV
jgi:hypothetical protein